MDEAKARDHIRQHAESVVNGDIDAVIADFSEELRPQVPQIAQSLPQPTTAAEVLSVEIADDEAVAMIRYTGDSGVVTIRSHWQEQAGRPQIIAGEPVE